jgi:cation transport ATPase
MDNSRTARQVFSRQRLYLFNRHLRRLFTLFRRSTFLRSQNRRRYNFLGLWSIVLLTVCTIISMANVFTSGEFARWPWVTTAWALIFSATIDVNIVRMFVEGYIERAQGQRVSGNIAYAIGGVLAVVTGAALFLEGVEQSIGLTWDSDIMHETLGVLLALRVICVVILMSREGRRLGHVVHTIAKNAHLASIANAVQSAQAKPKREQKARPPVNTPPVQASVQVNTRAVQKNEHSNVTPLPRRGVQNEQKAREAIIADPAISLSQLATILKCSSRSTAKNFKDRVLQEANRDRLLAGV